MDEEALVAVGDLNSNISEKEGNRKFEVIAAALSDVVLEDMPVIFLPCHKPW